MGRGGADKPGDRLESTASGEKMRRTKGRVYGCIRRQIFDREGALLVEFNRRNFLRAAATASAGTLLAPGLDRLAGAESEPGRTIAANDQIQIALIGAG